MKQALTGVRILDLTHMLSGPYGSMILADLGAETIKVEPCHGEGTRKLLATDPENSLDGMGAYYITLNRNKKSIAVDLKTPEGLALFKDLVKTVDVVSVILVPVFPNGWGLITSLWQRLTRALLPAPCRASAPTVPAVSGQPSIRWLKLWGEACRLLAPTQSIWFAPASLLVILGVACLGSWVS